MKKTILTFIVTVLCLTGCTDKEEMNVISDSVSLEYGNTLSTDIKDYLDNTEEYIKDVVAVFPENEDGKQYLSVGEYKIILTKDNEESAVKVTVKDTVSPKFTTIKNKYEVKYGKSFDSSQIVAEDLTQVKITVNDEEVDYKKAGDYKVKVTAEDEHGNTAEKEITITVLEEEKTAAGTASSSKTDTSANSSGSSSNKTGTTSNKPASSGSSSDKTSGTSSNNKTQTGTSASSSASSEKSDTTDIKENTSEQVQSSEKTETASHEHEGPAIENKYFDSCDELDVWAREYRLHKLFVEEVQIGGAYGVAQCSCGKYYVHRFY